MCELTWAGRVSGMWKRGKRRSQMQNVGRRVFFYTCDHAQAAGCFLLRFTVSQSLSLSLCVYLAHPLAHSFTWEVKDKEVCAMNWCSSASTQTQLVLLHLLGHIANSNPPILKLNLEPDSILNLKTTSEGSNCIWR